MIDPKYKTLIQSLVAKTQDKKLKWDYTSNPCRFEVEVGGQIISIYSSADEEPNILKWDLNRPEAVLSIQNDEGKTIGGVITYSKDADYKALQPLYLAAKASATNLDETLDSLIFSLDNL